MNARVCGAPVSAPLSPLMGACKKCRQTPIFMIPLSPHYLYLIPISRPLRSPSQPEDSESDTLYCYCTAPAGHSLFRLSCVYLYTLYRTVHSMSTLLSRIRRKWCAALHSAHTGLLRGKSTGVVTPDQVSYKFPLSVSHASDPANGSTTTALSLKPAM